MTNPDDAHHDVAYDFLSQHVNDASFVLAEQVLIELYGLLRNPVIMKRPLSAGEAVEVIMAYRRNSAWSIVDVPTDGKLMREVWRRAAVPGFARRRIHDLRLAMTLKHWGVTDFYTRNVRDFTDSDWVFVTIIPFLSPKRLTVNLSFLVVIRQFQANLNGPSSFWNPWRMSVLPCMSRRGLLY